MKNKFTTPILFVIFNRPQNTAQVFERIRQMQPTKLYIAADGPRTNRPDDIEKCRLTREVIEKIDWDCQVQKLFRDKNLGCKTAVSSAISWFFENEEAGIILEDDCLPDLTFFPFCAELLAKYRDDLRVGMISGDNFQYNHKRGEASYYFSNFPHIWGWATWRRAWKIYDAKMTGWPKYKNKLKQNFRYKINYKNYYEMFDNVENNQIDTWDYQWHFTLLSNNLLSIIPNQNLITNTGVGSDTTHGSDKRTRSNFLETKPLQFPLRHPDRIETNKEADHYHEFRNLAVPLYLAKVYKFFTYFEL